MQSDFKTELRQVQHQYLLDAGGGVSLPVAGAVYWIVLAVLAGQMDVAQWAFWAAALSGAIFPLGLLLQKPLRSPFMKSKSPLSGVVMLAILDSKALVSKVSFRSWFAVTVDLVPEVIISGPASPTR